MSELDAPNQQVVRPDGSAPWDEGEGGSTHEPESRSASEEGEKTVDLRSHAGLDTLAADQGHVWSSDDLTVAEKREELGV